MEANEEFRIFVTFLEWKAFQLVLTWNDAINEFASILAHSPPISILIFIYLLDLIHGDAAAAAAAADVVRCHFRLSYSCDRIFCFLCIIWEQRSPF